MRLTLLVATLLFLDGCRFFSGNSAKAVPQGERNKVANGDSPIVVADGSSLHARFKGDYIRVHSDTHASVNTGNVAVKFEVSGCPASDGCTAALSPVNLPTTAKWTLTANDGTVISMDPTSASEPHRIDIQFASGVKAEKRKSDGVGLYEDSVNLIWADLFMADTGNTVRYHCPTTPPQEGDGTNYCRMVIHYCGNGAC